MEKDDCFCVLVLCLYVDILFYI